MHRHGEGTNHSIYAKKNHRKEEEAECTYGLLIISAALVTPLKIVNSLFIFIW